MTPDPLIPPHGGYRDLKSYQMAEIIYDATTVFRDRFINIRSRTHDQMVQAARSGKQNIARGSIASGTSYQSAFIHITSLTSSSVRRRTKMYASVTSSSSPRSIFESKLVPKTELKLISVARASLEELLLDFQDFLRQRKLPLWPKGHPQAQEVRVLAYRSNRSYSTYKTYFENSSPEASAEVAANAAICVIHQANYLLDQQLKALEKAFLEEGGFTERLYRVRTQARERKKT
jgi:restriction system protein